MKQQIWILIVMVNLILAATEVFGQNITNETNMTPPIESFDIMGFLPTKFNLGDIQFNVMIKNDGNVPLTDISAIVAGEGISTFDVIPIDVLLPDAKSYVLIFAHADTPGKQSLTLRIKDKSLKIPLEIIDPHGGDEAIKQQEDEAKRLENEQKIQNRTLQLKQKLDNLTIMYDDVEAQFYLKKSQDYNINTDIQTAKSYLRNAQASFAKRDLDNTDASLIQLESELVDVGQYVDTATKNVRTFDQKVKDNIPWITALLTGIIAIITIVGHFSRKTKELTEKLKKASTEKEKLTDGKSKKNAV